MSPMHHRDSIQDERVVIGEATGDVNHEGVDQQVRALVKRVERALDLGQDVSPDDVDALHTLSPLLCRAPSTPRRARLRSRLAAVEARLGLRARTEPASSFEGLYERVATRVVEESATSVDAAGEAVRWRRAALSNSFLDAPRALMWWRVAACTAVALLAVGAWAWQASSDGDSRATIARGDSDVLHRSRVIADDDMRHGLLTLHPYGNDAENNGVEDWAGDVEPVTDRPLLARPVRFGANSNPDPSEGMYSSALVKSRKDGVEALTGRQIRFSKHPGSSSYSVWIESDAGEPEIMLFVDRNQTIRTRVRSRSGSRAAIHSSGERTEDRK